MAEPDAYEPDEDDIAVHRDDGRHVYFNAYVNYGVGEPHFYVCLDEMGGGRREGWWMEADQAELLGRRLLQLAEEARKRTSQDEERRAQLERERATPDG